MILITNCDESFSPWQPNSKLDLNNFFLLSGTLIAPTPGYFFVMKTFIRVCPTQRLVVVAATQTPTWDICICVELAGWLAYVCLLQYLAVVVPCRCTSFPNLQFPCFVFLFCPFFSFILHTHYAVRVCVCVAAASVVAFNSHQCIYPAGYSFGFHYSWRQKCAHNCLFMELLIRIIKTHGNVKLLISTKYRN